MHWCLTGYARGCIGVYIRCKAFNGDIWVRAWCLDLFCLFVHAHASLTGFGKQRTDCAAEQSASPFVISAHYQFSNIHATVITALVSGEACI